MQEMSARCWRSRSPETSGDALQTETQCRNALFDGKRRYPPSLSKLSINIFDQVSDRSVVRRSVRWTPDVCDLIPFGASARSLPLSAWCRFRNKTSLRQWTLSCHPCPAQQTDWQPKEHALLRASF